MTIPGGIKILEQSSEGHGQLSIASEARCEAEKQWRHHRTECGEWLAARLYHRNGAGGRTTVGRPCLLQPVYWRRNPCSLSSLLQPTCVQANRISGRLIPLWQWCGCCTSKHGMLIVSTPPGKPGASVFHPSEFWYASWFHLFGITSPVSAHV